MSKLPIVIAALCLSCVALPVAAATASNSQAGSEGGSKNTCAATPYFAEGGCLSSDPGGILDDEDDNRLPRGAAPRPRRGPLPDDDD